MVNIASTTHVQSDKYVMSKDGWITEDEELFQRKLTSSPGGWRYPGRLQCRLNPRRTSGPCSVAACALDVQ
jgi:hypothetical protein